ncbi:MAG TPA: TonB-dependent receptor [Gemmatimonadales bacterium]|nr:TonB-dependent receptor [Gemmatimonadales bacterium]
MKAPRFAPAIAVVLLLTTWRAASGQEAQDTTRLAEIVVTPTRLPTPADEVVASVTVISGDDLRARGVRFVQDALREVPGAAVVQGGSFGAVTSLFLRGGESDYVKVLVDGVAVNQSGGAFNWANLTTDNVDRIEVLRGPGSVLYGSDAVTGVVQIFTRRGEAGFGADGGGEAGTFGTVNGRAGVLGGTSRMTYSADASRFATDGTYQFNNDYGNTALSGSVRGLPDERTDASVTARYSDSRYHFPTDFAGVPSDSNQASAEEMLTLAADVGRRLGSGTDLRFTAGGNRTVGEFDDRPDNAADTLGFGFASQRDSRAQRGNLDARINGTVSPALTVTGGVQVERETERQSGETTSNFGGIATTPDTPFDRGRTTFGYYAQGVLDLASGLALNLNGRVDDNSAFGTFFTYRAGAVYRLSSGTRIRASLGRSFKAPTFCEQFCDAPFVVGDSTLQPERSTSWEAGVEQALGDGQVSIWATYFDQRFHDMIVYDGSGAPGEPTYFNGAAAKSRGIETGVTTSLGRDLKVSASYTYLMAEATDDGGLPTATFAAGERLIRRPQHSAELSARSRVLDRVTLGGSLIYMGSREDVDFNLFPAERVELPGYAIVDLATEVEVIQSHPGRPGLSAVLRAENLFDQAYDQVVGFAGRGRAVFGGAKFQF